MTTQTITPEDAAKARKILGLADDVDDAAVQSKLSELGDLVPKPAAVEPKGEPEPKVEETKETAAALSAETIKALKDAGLTVVTDGAFDELKANAQLGAAASSQLAAQARDALLDQAQRDGKFGGGEQAKTTRTSFSALLDKDFAGAKAVIDSLPAIAPTSELGSDATGAGDQLSAAADAALDAEIAELFGSEIPTPTKES